MAEPVSRQTAATQTDVMRARAAIMASLPTPLVGRPDVRDGLLAQSGAAVYSAGDIGERNATYTVAQYATGFLLIGDGSGGRGFLVRADDPDPALFSSDLGDLDPACFTTVSADFRSSIDSF